MEKLFMSVLEMGLRGSVVIGAVLLARLLLRKAPAAARYALWALVAVALAVPARFETGLSLMPAAREEPTETVVRVELPREAGALPEAEPGRQPDGSVTPPRPDEAPRALSGREIGTWVWLGGVGAMALWALTGWLRLLRRVRTAVHLKENIYLCDHIPSPFVWGLFRPRICLPSDLPEGLRGPVLAHERGHIFRMDHVARVLGWVILSVYWWAPTVWLAFILFCRDMEMACDEWVVRELDKKDICRYSEALIACSLPKASLRSFYLAFGEVGLKARIKNILRYKKPGLWITLAAVVLAAAVAVCFLTERPAAVEEAGTVPPAPTQTDPVPSDPSVSDATAPSDPDAIPPLELTGALSPEGAQAVADFRDGTGYGFFPDEAEELVRLLNALTAEDFLYEPPMSPVLSVTLTASGRDVYMESDTDLVVLVHEGIRWGIRDGALSEFFRLLYSVTDYEEQNIVPLQDVRHHYSMEEAMIDGCVIQEEGALRHNAHVWEGFWTACRAGEPATVRIWERTGDETLVWDLSFDGASYCRYVYEDGALSTQRWEYLHCFSGDAGEEDRYHYDHYILTDDPDCTWDEGSHTLHHSGGHHGGHHGGSDHRVCSLYTYYPDTPTLPGTPVKAELVLEGQVILATSVPESLGRLEIFFREAEETYEPKTYNPGPELVLSFAEGESVTAVLDLNYDLLILDGAFYDYGPGYTDEGSYNALPELLACFSITEWPQPVLDKYGDYIWW